MANRTTTHVLKNSDIVNRPLPASLLKGEPIVNTADGIVFFSGVTTSTNEWTPAGTGTTANFFEVGSNLYDLRLRNRITKYEGASGAGLAGKFLSGTTNGFVLANISSIVGVDTYVTGFTYSNNVVTLTQTVSGPTLSVLINSMTGLTVNGTLSATTANFDTENVSTLNATGGTITTLNSTTVNVTGTETVNNLTITGTGLYNTTPSGTNPNEIVNYGSLTAYTAANDVYVSGGTYAGGTLTLNRHNASAVTITGFTTTDTYVTGYTYNPATNTFTIKQNQGQADLTAQFTTVSGLTISNLTANRLVYTTTGGQLITGTAIFDGTNMTLPSAGSLTVGTGGLVVGSGGSAGVAGTGDLVVNGNLTVFGTSISAFTSQLYVEDPNITLNYNPTGNTTATSIGAGWTIQDGNGVNGGDVTLDIRAMNGFTGLTASQVPSITEYSGSTGYSNRAFVTQLNDIVIRSTNTTTPNGVRVLAEFDVLDGGSY